MAATAVAGSCQWCAASIQAATPATSQPSQNWKRLGLLTSASTPKVSRPITQKKRRNPSLPRIDTSAWSWLTSERKRTATMNATLSGSTRMPQKTPNSGAERPARSSRSGEVACRSQNVCVFSYTVMTWVSRKTSTTSATAERQAGERHPGLGRAPRRLGEEAGGHPDQRAAGRSPR